MAETSKTRTGLVPGLLTATGSAVAAFVVSRMDYSGVMAAAWQTPPAVFAMSLVLGLAGMTAMGLYDVLAVRIAVPGCVGDGFAWATGVKAYGVSNLPGFAMLTGGAVRFPIYRDDGVDLAALGNAMALSWGSGLVDGDGRGWRGAAGTPGGHGHVV